ncbi:MAG: PAS domain-containing protein [Pseudomonadota bacterium]
MCLNDLEVFSKMPFFFWVKDESGKYLFGNQTIANYAGEDIVGKFDRDLVWGDDAEALLEADRQVFESGKPLYVQESVEKSSHGMGATFNVCKWLEELDGKRCCFGLSFIIE